MRGKAYAIMTNENKIVAISLSRLNAQEMLMEYTFEDDYYHWLWNIHFWNDSPKEALKNIPIRNDYHIEVFELI